MPASPVLGGLIVTVSAEPVRGGVNVGAPVEPRGGGRATEPLPVSLELELPELVEPEELGRTVVPVWTDSEAVQAIGIFTDPDAVPA